jgi:ribosome biogenesis GTPase
MESLHENNILINYGWNCQFANDFAPFADRGFTPARITRSGRGIFGAVSTRGGMSLKPSGSFRHLTELGIQEAPVLGDWCAVSGTDDSHGLIEGVLPRRTVLYSSSADSTRETTGSRKAAFANADTVAVVMDTAYDFNLRRIERFSANIEAGGAEAALILTKIDLVDDPESFRRRTADRFSSLRICLVDSLSGRGREELEPLLRPGRTAVMVGLSGAGKSTLLNMLTGRQAAKTAAVREQDGRGRHTTTERTLYLLPGGGLLADTPGIRAVGISADLASVRSSFEDIHELAAGCRFADCSHRHEPGCAVRAALAEGLIEKDRYRNFLRILSEAVSEEEKQHRRREKDKHIGKIQYQMRKERNRKEKHM